MNILKIFITISVLVVCRISLAQTPIDVIESTIKIPGLSEEVMYVGFAEGDKIVFTFQEQNKKELKELEVTEWPSSTRFAEFKIDNVERKIIDVPRTAVYKFRFANSALGGRICRIHIQRIPASLATEKFNTLVGWRSVTDTTFTPFNERYLVSSDTVVTHVVDQVAKVSSQMAANGNPNFSVVDIDMPAGTTAWSYFIGVGKEGQQAFDQAAGKLLTSTANSVSKIDGYGTMAALAIYGLNLFVQVQGSNNVKYWIIPDWSNVQLFQSRQPFQAYKLGDVVNDASRMTYPLGGKVYIGLMNDNLVEPIEVIVKVTAIRVVEKWGERLSQRMNLNTRSEPFLKNQ